MIQICYECHEYHDEHATVCSFCTKYTLLDAEIEQEHEDDCLGAVYDG